MKESYGLPPPKFKIGDRVMVKNTCQVEYLRGKTGIIYAIDPNGHASSPYQVAEATNYHWYADFDLEKIEDSAPPKFKVGDPVRAKKGPRYNDPGEIVALYSPTPKDAPTHATVSYSDSCELKYSIEDIEKIPDDRGPQGNKGVTGILS